MKKINFLALLCLIVMAIACNGRKQEAVYKKYEPSQQPQKNHTKQEESRQQTESEAPTQAEESDQAPQMTHRQKTQDAGVIQTNLDSQKDKKFIRTAETKCKVKSVEKATRNLEALAVKYKGFITNGNFQSQITNQFTKPATQDSLLSIKVIQVIHDVTLRIPNQTFDSLLRDVQKMADFVDYRIIKANDVSLQIMAKNMFIDRFKNYENTYNKMYGSNTTYGQDNLLSNQNNNDQQKLEKLRLEDEVSLSTVQIHLYQKEYAYQEMVLNTEKIAYTPSIFVRMQDALYKSWLFMEEVLIGIVSLWFFWIVLIVAILVWRKIRSN